MLGGRLLLNSLVRSQPQRTMTLGWNLSMRTGGRFFCSDREPIVFNVQDYDDFQSRVVNSSIPVIVDFHADWCGPCKMLGPRLESIVDNREGQVILAKVNIDDNQDLAMDFGVEAVPTIMAFKNGEQHDSSLVGMVEDEKLNAFIDDLVLE